MSAVPQVFFGELVTTPGFPPRTSTNLSPNDLAKIVDGDIIVYRLKPLDTRISFWPQHKLFRFSGNNARSATPDVPVKFTGEMLNFEQWLAPLRSAIHGLQDIGKTIIFRISAMAPAIEANLGFKASPKWSRFSITYNLEKRLIESVYVIFSEAKSHGFSLRQKNFLTELAKVTNDETKKAAVGKKIFASIQEAYKKSIASFQKIGVYMDNCHVKRASNGIVIGRNMLIAKGWKTENRRMIGSSTMITILVGPPAQTEAQIRKILESSERFGFSYKIVAAPVNYDLEEDHSSALLGFPSLNFRVLPSKKVVFSIMTVHNTLIDLAMIFADQFGLSTYPIYWIADNLPFMEQWTLYAKITLIESVIKSVREVRSKRGSRRVSSSSVKFTNPRVDLRRIRLGDRSTINDTASFGWPLHHIPLRAPQTVNPRLLKKGVLSSTGSNEIPGTKRKRPIPVPLEDWDLDGEEAEKKKNPSSKSLADGDMDDDDDDSNIDESDSSTTDDDDDENSTESSSSSSTTLSSSSSTSSSSSSSSSYTTSTKKTKTVPTAKRLRTTTKKTK
jgi:hypothetical protein